MANKVLIDRAVVQQALVALEDVDGPITALLGGLLGSPDADAPGAKVRTAITALRAALAQAEPVQKSGEFRVMVCGVHCHPGDQHCNGYCTGKTDDPPEATAEQQAEPVRDLYWRLHNLSKALEGSSRIDADDYPDAYTTILDAMVLAQKAEPTRSQRLADAGFTRRPSLWALQARHALAWIAAPQRADGTWNRDREACRQLAAEALGRYDDE